MTPDDDAAVGHEAGNRASAGWLNRTVLGIGLASLFSDVGHEMATSAMPALLASIGAIASSAALGLIEGISDCLASSRWAS